MENNVYDFNLLCLVLIVHLVVVNLLVPEKQPLFFIR